MWKLASEGYGDVVEVELSEIPCKDVPADVSMRGAAHR